MVIGPDEVIHRVGGSSVPNLRPSAVDRRQSPPGISLLAGGTPAKAAADMRLTFGQSKKWRTATSVVASTTVAAVRAAGFDVLWLPTDRFQNHVRLIHPDGEAEFTDDNLTRLAAVFVETRGL